ncbi:STAS domain-containing protein [Blastomonas aquatica]|uniref:MlaB-like STAS domain-containing protein n=1 Tax=Blastomonas aquatica TaxID=1510276 RepID=A0ABQ1JP86_9SPHN|nr:STAS domain-containing protein [Blastomonas aquatica]GGB74097.1 hypothetical protein GCM10010833_31660 [Blastomonas aquatica]
MNSTPNQPDSHEPLPVLKLPANGTTASAESLRAQLVALLEGPGPAAIDASEVENIGQAVLQLLVAAQTEARAAGQAIEITDPSPAFCERVDQCRLAEPIGLQLEGAEA